MTGPDGPWGSADDVPTGTAEEMALARVEAVQRAADVVLADGAIYAVPTPQGEVHICEVTRQQDGPAAWVEVKLHGETQGGDPVFRIFNPPMLAEDPAGPIEINGRRYREDPIAAVAQVVGSLGGATINKGRGL